jgi:large subunit ribosomal protein L22
MTIVTLTDALCKHNVIFYYPMKASLSQYRQSPRKVRLVADMIRGKDANTALTILTLVPKKAGLPIKKLLQSAISNAKNSGIDVDTLVVKEMRVDGGVVMKRQMPRAFGRAYVINKRTSHINLVLDTKQEIKNVKSKIKKGNTEKVEKVEKIDKKPAKKAVAKKSISKKVTK